MRVQVVDPPAFTPPYDHSLCAALSRAGAEVELVTSRFLYGPVPSENGYGVSEAFYRRSAERGLEARGRRAFKLAEHVRDMRRYRAQAELADLVHWQWLPVPRLDRRLLAPKRPRVFTLHHFLPQQPEPAPGARGARPARGDGRRRHALPGRQAAARGGVRRPRGPGRGDPARRLRLPDPAARGGAAAPPSSRAPRAR